MRLFNEAPPEPIAKQPKVVMVIFEKPAEVKKLQAELEAFLQEKGRRKNSATHRLSNLLEGAEVY